MTVILWLVGAALLSKFGALVLAFAGVAIGGWAVGKWLARRDDRTIARRWRDAATAARADEQNQLVYAGDPRGIYGLYPPAAGL
ncbi:hypothetical protein [Mycobacterium shigaense]|uniref:hypothetical protein n=1 Tax=Mycobacterium shigaense TaxID=722731 RepID=UPI002AE00450|nr:hypothetical protein [Mycobacterium shigaense]MEA1123900.1 hypothetical protein [Mycobacterium shigaense]